MKNKIVIFDPPMCCSSGICGPNPDTTLIDFQDLFTKLKNLVLTLRDILLPNLRRNSKKILK